MNQNYPIDADISMIFVRMNDADFFAYVLGEIMTGDVIFSETEFVNVVFPFFCFESMNININTN